MPHEMGPSASDSESLDEHARARRLLNEDAPSEGETSEAELDSNRAPTFSHEENIPDDEYGAIDDVPLLPHERPSVVREHSGSSTGLANYAKQAPPSPSFFTKRTGTSIFRNRSHPSSLPHSLPRSDADDEDLLDPSLEAFPTQREHILERVATIGSHLPEDEAVLSLSGTHSPEFSIASQACSSVDLVPIGSHTSLRRIAEEALMETDEDEDMDLGSPVLQMASGANVSASKEASADDDQVLGDELVTPMPQEERQDYFCENQEEVGSVKKDDCSQDLGTADGVLKNDGADDKITTLPGWWKSSAIDRPASALDPILTAPYTTQETVASAKRGKPQVSFNVAGPKNLVKTPASPRDNAAATGEHPNIFVRIWRKLFSE
jgi:hypothetical protein